MKLGPSSSGSTSLTLLVSAAALTLGGFYAASKSKQTQNAVEEYRINRAREATQMTGISNLATIRGLFATTKVGTHYEPAVFPGNYFATTWDLQKNPSIAVQKIALRPGEIDLMTFAPGDHTLQKVAPILAGQSQTEILSSLQTHKIVAMNPHPDHPYYIRSIDVSMDREIGKAQRRLETVGRIFLDAPIPSGLRVLVKAPGAASFTEEFGSESNPLPPGKYTIQLRGTGVVQFGEVTLDGRSFQVGFDEKGSIAHKANNAKAEDKIIGEFSTDINPPGTVTREVSTTKGPPEKCTIGGTPEGVLEATTTEIVSTGAASGINLVAKLYGVDDQVSEAATRNITLFVGGSKSSKTTTVAKTANPAGLACQNSCPQDLGNDFEGSLGSMAAALDLGANAETNFKKVDFFDKKKTAGTIARSARGIVCANHDLMGQIMAVNTGKKPSQILRENPAQFEQLLDNNAQFKRYYAFVAPHCVRTLINDRDGCGCFAADTKILMGDKTEKAASDIRKGDLLWNPKLNKAQAVKRVVRGPELVPMFALDIDGKNVVVTGGHPFLTERGLLPAHKLEVGDTILDGDKATKVHAVTVQKADKANPPIVWNFELEGGSSPSEHYVLANGVMTGDLYLQESLAGGKDTVARNEP